MKLRALIFILLLVLSTQLISQEVKLDNLKEQFSKDELFKLNGGVSASTVFYEGNNKNRDPFNWVLSGSLNMNFYRQFNLPFSFNLNNLGGNYTYPTMPNRISLHPTYKWVTGHVGDVSMNFSPFTLAGHQFTGVGVDLNPPDNPLKISAMYGRLLKATAYDSTRLGTTAFKRMGYAIKAQYEKEKYLIGMSLFRGFDDLNSLSFVPDALNITPKSNIAFSWDLGFKVIKNLNLTAEYGLSILTRDTRFSDQQNFLNKIFSSNITTTNYHAIKTNLNYSLLKNSFGLGYERIDPQYQSLGAYYFVNDLENFTFNFARPFLKDKLTFAFNVGLQHDNLDQNKAEETNRFVGTLNLNYSANEKLNMGFNYSNFQTYTNIKSPFDYINEITNYDNLDTLNFTQLSQNANFNLGYNFNAKESKKHNIGILLNYQEAADKQGDIIRNGSVSRFYNTAINYGLLFVPTNIQLTMSTNLSYSNTGGNKIMTVGPTIGASGRFKEKKLSSGIFISYNMSKMESSWQSSITNLRWNMGYQILKNHNFNLILLTQIRNVQTRETSNDMTTTLSYSYSF